MRKVLFSILLITLILALGNNSFAFNYSESVSGDLLFENLGTLDLGTNTVSGSFYQDTTSSPTELDQDPFNFTVDSGMILTSITMSFSTTFNNLTGGYAAASVDWQLYNLSPYGIIEDFSKVDLLGISPVEIFPGFLGIGAGNYRMTHSSTVSTGDNWASDYAINLVATTASVPVPSTVFLLSFGLLGFAGVYRRKN